MIQLVENVQREDLSQADLYQALNALWGQRMSLKQIAEVMGKTEGYIKKIFVRVNEIGSDNDLEEAIGYAGVTIEDIIEITRSEMRQKAKDLRTGNARLNETRPAGGEAKPMAARGTGDQGQKMKVVMEIRGREIVITTAEGVDKAAFHGLCKDLERFALSTGSQV